MSDAKDAAREWLDALDDGDWTEGTYTSLAVLIEAREAALQAQLDLIVGKDPCPKCGAGIRPQCYGCEVAALQAQVAALTEANRQIRARGTMTDDDVLAALDKLFAEIESAKGDDEAQHSDEDNMHKLALRAIRDGAERPAAIAESALRASGMPFCRWCA